MRRPPFITDPHRPRPALSSRAVLMMRDDACNRFTEVDHATLEGICVGFAEIPRANWIDKKGLTRDDPDLGWGEHAKALNDAVIAARLYPPKDWRLGDPPPSR